MERDPLKELAIAELVDRFNADMEEERVLQEQLSSGSSDPETQPGSSTQTAGEPGIFPKDGEQ